MMSRWLAAIFAGGLVACGISAVGQLATDPIEPDAGIPDGGIGAPADGATDGAVDADGGAPRVVILPEDGGACPAGTTEDVVQTNPQVAADACSCGACTTTTAPSCNTGAISVDVSTGNASCNQGTLPYANVPNETCTDFGIGTVTQAAYERWQARTPVGGACTAAPVADPSKATSTALRRCVATTTDAAAIVPSGGQKKCIESSAPCEGDYPVAVAYGSGASVTCSACGCTLGATGCVVEHFSDGACTDLRYQQALNGVCTRTTDATNVRYFKVRATGLTCVATAGTPTATLTNPGTLCCAN